MRHYDEFTPTFSDFDMWVLPKVLRVRAETHADCVFLDVPEEGRRWTFSETHTAARRVAAGLRAAGGTPGDRIVMMVPNGSDFVFSWFGIAATGLVEVPINTAYVGQFLENQVRTVAPRFAIVDEAFATRFANLPGISDLLERFWVTGAEPGAAIDILRKAGVQAEPWEGLARDPDESHYEPTARDLAAIFFTSGTTGASKGVMTPNAQLTIFADLMKSVTRLTERDVVLSVLPLFHGNAQHLGAFPALLAGARFVLRRKFSASRWIDWVRESGATVTNLLGVMMDFVWKQPPRPIDADNALRCVWSVPIAHGIADAFQERFGIETLASVYGSSEASLPMMTPYGEKRRGAAGLLVRDLYETRIVDPETDLEVPPGASGELLVRAKLPWTTFQGYWGMPEATAASWRNLWFHTGDGLRRDEEGWYYFADRLKDALRRRGENISSYEVEQALLQHERLLECAVLGVPSEIDGGEDEMIAWLVPREEVSPEDVWEWAEEVLPAFMVPRYIRFTDKLPKTPSNKVEKARLRQLGVNDAHDRTKNIAV